MVLTLLSEQNGGWQLVSGTSNNRKQNAISQITPTTIQSTIYICMYECIYM